METETQKPIKNQVATKQSNAIVNNKEFDDIWGDEVAVTSDIIIPKILLMHPTSDLVKGGTRNQGDIVKSTDGELVSKRGEFFEFILFEKPSREWRIMEKSPTGRYEYVRTESWTPANDNADWDYKENGKEYRRDKTMNIYALLTTDIKQGIALPVKLSFVRTNYKIGMKLASAFATDIKLKKPPTRRVYKLCSELTKGKEESYFTFKFEPGRISTTEEMLQGNAWHKTFKAGTANISTHEVDDNVDSTPVASNNPTTNY